MYKHFFSLPMGFFPRSLKKPETDGYEKGKSNDEKEEIQVMEDKHHNKSWVGRMWSDTCQLGRNPLFVSYTVAAVTSSWVMAVKSTFGQKYIEMQFGLTPAEATQYKTYMIGSLVIGMMASGIVLKLAKFKAHGLAIFNTTTHFAYLLSFLSLAFLSGCTPQTSEDIFGLQNETFAAPSCHCDQVYNPVCLHNFTFNGQQYDQLTVINPCVAGCQSFTMDEEIKRTEVFGCEMEQTSIKTRDYIGCSSRVESGVCNPDECEWKVQVYMVVIW